MKFLIYLLIGLSMVSCLSKKQQNTVANPNEKIILVNHFRVICEGESTKKCLQIKEITEEGIPEYWSSFFAEIEGFVYEPGFIYKLKIKETKLDTKNLPADASSVKRTLVELIEKTEVPISPLNGKWKAVSINEVTANLVAQISPFITLDNEKMGGYDGCNALFSSYKKSLTALKFDGIGRTKMGCGNGDIYKVSEAFKLGLTNTYRYKINENNLSLLNGKGEVLITLIRN